MTSTPLPLPTISLTDRKNLSRSILEACTTSGFFYLTDHGLSTSLIDSVFKTSSKLFLNSNLDSKLSTIDRSNNVGYTPMMTENLDLEKSNEKAQGDLKESFYLPRLIDQDQQHPQHLAPKVKLTEELKENKKDLEDLIEGCKNVCDSLLEGFAEALELPSRFFAQHHHGAHDRLRLIHYPPTEVPTSEVSDSIRAGSHSDYGSCTLLFQKEVGGLQVLMNQEWIDIPPSKDGALVVNIGDAMEFWTSGAFKSTQHRVVLPRNQDEAISRFSAAFFLQPDEDCVLEPLSIKRKDISIEEQEVERDRFREVLKRKGIEEGVERLTGGQHLKRRLEATYG